MDDVTDHRRPQFVLFGAVLAFLAVFALSALSGWHSALIHDHDPGHGVSAGHAPKPSDKTGPDGAIHVTAHVAGQWIAPTAQPGIAVFALVAKQVWPAFDPVVRIGHDPSKLLRPPRG